MPMQLFSHYYYILFLSVTSTASLALVSFDSGSSANLKFLVLEGLVACVSTPVDLTESVMVSKFSSIVDALVLVLVLVLLL